MFLGTDSGVKIDYKPVKKVKETSGSFISGKVEAQVSIGDTNQRKRTSSSSCNYNPHHHASEENDKSKCTRIEYNISPSLSAAYRIPLMFSFLSLL